MFIASLEVALHTLVAAALQEFLDLRLSSGNREIAAVTAVSGILQDDLLSNGLGFTKA